VVFFSTAWGQGQPPPAASQDLAHAQGTNLGIFTFTGRCATCHDINKDGAPDRYTLNRLTPEQILENLNVGSMAQYAKGLSELEKRVVAVYVGGHPLGSAKEGEASAMPNRCTTQRRMSDLTKPSGWNGWGYDSSNSRFQPAPGLTAGQVPQLKLKWAFGFPNANSVYAQPAVVAGRVFAAADTGFVYSLDAASGCVYWSFRANAGVRTAVSVGPGTSGVRYLAYFGDIKGNVYAVNAETGAEVWKQRADKHPVARITGAPKLEEGRLYVPVASLEESGGGNPNYPCCTFRGSVVAYDGATGKQIWKSYTIPEEAKPVPEDFAGNAALGSGGSRGMVVSGHRSKAPRYLRCHRQWLYTACSGRIRCGCGI
jgi:polyvinyl alcohol dehydrogenase (cytochrome)